MKATTPQLNKNVTRMRAQHMTTGSSFMRKLQSARTGMQNAAGGMSTRLGVTRQKHGEDSSAGPDGSQPVAALSVTLPRVPVPVPGVEALVTGVEAFTPRSESRSLHRAQDDGVHSPPIESLVLPCVLMHPSSRV